MYLSNLLNCRLSIITLAINVVISEITIVELHVHDLWPDKLHVHVVMFLCWCVVTLRHQTVGEVFKWITFHYNMSEAPVSSFQRERYFAPQKMISYITHLSNLLRTYMYM